MRYTLFDMLEYIFTRIFLIYIRAISFVQEKEKKRQKILKLLENKNVGTRLGTADDETPSTSTAPSTSAKSKLKSGKIHVTSHTCNCTINSMI